MARLQRTYSNSGYYHIMLRGNARKKLFMDDKDRQKFIEITHKKKTATNLKIYAYCLMDNHIHLVLRDDKNEISIIMKGIATSYAMFFNNKYGRVGHIFQDRFKSEAIENERHLMAVIRYVHNNPVKAFMVENPEQYKWSSIQCYTTPDPIETIVDAGFILKIISENQRTAVEEFRRFSAIQDKTQFMDEDQGGIRTLEDGDAYLERFLQTNWPGLDKTAIINNKNILNDVVVELRTNTNLSIVKIATLLGVNRGMVERTRP